VNDFLLFIKEEWHLFLLFAGVLSLIIYEEIINWLYGDVCVSVEQCAVAINKQEPILDIRSQEKFSQGHISGAMNVKAQELRDNPEQYLSRDKQNILICEDGQESVELARLIKAKQGYNMKALDGGFQSWEDNGFVKAVDKRKGKSS